MTQADLFNPLLGDDIQKVTIPNYQVFQTVTEARSAAHSAELADSPVCYIEEKEAFYNFCPDCGLPDDGDLVLTTGAGGNSRWELVQKVSRTQGDTGWIHRNGLTVTRLNNTTLRASLTDPAYYAVNSKRITLAAGNYDISFTGTARTIAVIFDANGAIAQSDNVPGALFTSTPVAIVFWTGSVIGGIQTEFHGIRDTVWHAWAHKYLGTQYDSGLSITTNTQPDNNTDPGADNTVHYLWLTPGSIYDEDTEITIGSGNWAQTLGSGLTSTTAAVIPFFYFNGTAVVGAAANADREPFLFTGTNGTPQRNNGGTLTAGVAGEYIVYHYFASPFIDGYSIFARPHNNTTPFTTLIAAQAARPSSLVWSAIGEWKHIYTVIYRCGNWGGTPQHNCKIVSVQDFRLVSSGPASGVNASAHSALSGLADAGAHPASAIAPDTTNFGGALRATDDSLQKVADRLDDFTSVLDWVTGRLYRVGNVVRITAAVSEGFTANWRCVSEHTSGTFATDVNNGNWEIFSNSEGARELVNQASHGFAAGTPVARVGGTYVAASCTTEALSEVYGIITGVTTNYFVLAKTGRVVISGGAWPLEGGNGNLVDNTTYWLAATAGKITATKPTTVGYIEKPVINSKSTTSGDVLGMRGSAVGGANVYTIIALSNNATTTLQNVSGASFPAGSAGFIEGFIKIDATTDYVFTFKAEWSKPLTGTGYNVTPTYGAGDIPAGTSISITTGGEIQITLPSISGFSSASATFSMQAAAIGAQLPLQIDVTRVTLNNGSATPTTGVLGEVQKSSNTGQSFSSAAGTVNVTSVNISAGVWMLSGHFLGVSSGTTTGGTLILTHAGGTSTSQLTGYSSSTQILTKRDSDNALGATISGLHYVSSGAQTIYLNLYRANAVSISSAEWALTAIRIG